MATRIGRPPAYTTALYAAASLRRPAHRFETRVAQPVDRAEQRGRAVVERVVVGQTGDVDAGVGQDRRRGRRAEERVRLRRRGAGGGRLADRHLDVDQAHLRVRQTRPHRAQRITARVVGVDLHVARREQPPPCAGLAGGAAVIDGTVTTVVDVVVTVAAATTPVVSFGWYRHATVEVAVATSSTPATPAPGRTSPG